MIWKWDPVKAKSNRRKHGVSFELALEVFEDPYQLTLLDPNEDEERWRTIGQPFLAQPNTILVVHTWPDDDVDGRIISAREATKPERNAYDYEKKKR